MCNRQNETSGFTVLKCRVKNSPELITGVGSMAETLVESVLTLIGLLAYGCRIRQLQPSRPCKI